MSRDSVSSCGLDSNQGEVLPQETNGKVLRLDQCQSSGDVNLHRTSDKAIQRLLRRGRKRKNRHHSKKKHHLPSSKKLHLLRPAAIRRSL